MTAQEAIDQSIQSGLTVHLIWTQENVDYLISKCQKRVTTEECPTFAYYTSRSPRWKVRLVSLQGLSY